MRFILVIDDNGPEFVGPAHGAYGEQERAMKLVFRDINVYFFHDGLGAHDVRGAIYGTSDHPSLLPEVGDVLHDFPGYMGKPITVRVIEVKQFGQGVEAYEVHVTDES